MLKRIILTILKQPMIKEYAKRTYHSLRYELQQPEIAAGANFDIAEASPVQVRKSSLEMKRINILVPALSLEHVFGGIATALDLFDEVRKYYPNARILLTDEPHFSVDRNPAYSMWKVQRSDDNDSAGLLVLPIGDRKNKSIPICAGDRFIATAWWTALAAFGIQDAQSLLFNIPHKKLVYLIQDYEPGFYPWSARYGLAESTYHCSERYVAVFNTSILKDFFDAEGYSFKDAISFEPKLNRALSPKLSNSNAVKQKKILVYGRPSVERNAFPIIIMALRHWIDNGGGEGWSFFSAGEKHESIDLGGGHKLVSHGKLSLEKYAQELSETAIGISLMVSPHPSYPPLEMSAFGIRVITNSYKNKDLSSELSNVFSVESLAPDSISELLDFVSRDANFTEPASENKPERQKGRFSGFLNGGELFEHVVPYVQKRLY